MALIPPQYLNSVVSIEVEDKINGKVEKTSIATGFLFGKLIEKNMQTNISTYTIYLVTNRHVFENKFTKNLLEKVFLRFNLSENKGAKYYQIDLLDKNNNPIWFKPKRDEVDIAIIRLNGNRLRDEKIDFYFFREDLDVFLANKFEEIGVATGDSVFVLGFPLGIRGDTKNFAIVKKGIIARFDEELLRSCFYFIDASAYPGNSGGPVVYKPEIVAIEKTKSVTRSALIGVISEGVSFREIAISQQTNRPRIVFEEQTGLVKVVPIDLVLETINNYQNERGTPKQKEKILNKNLNKENNS